MNHEFHTVAWIKSQRGLIQIPVLVMYEHDNGKPWVYGVFEKADPENDLTNAISDTEHELIYHKVTHHINEMHSEAEELASEGDR